MGDSTRIFHFIEKRLRLRWRQDHESCISGEVDPEYIVEAGFPKRPCSTKMLERKSLQSEAISG
jgi:hypothetical protein